MTFSDQYIVALATATFLRGIGAGMITGVLLIVPSRRRIGLAAYAVFTRAQYQAFGVKVYAASTIAGSLLTLVLLAVTFQLHDSVAQRWSLVASGTATIFAFGGTSRAFPTMMRLWSDESEDCLTLTHLLDTFVWWGWFSAAWHLVAFGALLCALVAGW
jgi:hypothetical protein